MEYPLRIIIILIIGISVVLIVAFAFKGYIFDVNKGLSGTADITESKTIESIKIGKCNTLCTANCINPEDGFEWVTDGEDCKDITNQDCSCK